MILLEEKLFVIYDFIRGKTTGFLRFYSRKNYSLFTILFEEKLFVIHDFIRGETIRYSRITILFEEKLLVIYE